MAAKLPDSDENQKAAEPAWLLPVKIAVVVMGIMIFVGLGVIAYTIATRLAGSGDQEVAEAPVVAPAPAAGTTQPVATPFGTVHITVPRGGRLGAAQFDDGRMILQMNLPNRKIRLLVFDLATGKELGAFELAPANN
ncbi:hypothetical protein NUH88_16825 [Nisaea acidiphila]|uniref:Uncharacterized protein n=1 Tax=Nisaea acidiphila TaxID=1862145 RepID=A0A9J7ANR8_9PROT|nr:hypothetical protein [Nisaea acidiphila]UUX49056.1 hypothetical protein NUH88_16825 [Nisaea acidiphila]